MDFISRGSKFQATAPLYTMGKYVFNWASHL